MSVDIILIIITREHYINISQEWHVSVDIILVIITGEHCINIIHSELYFLYIRGLVLSDATL